MIGILFCCIGVGGIISFWAVPVKKKTSVKYYDTVKERTPITCHVSGYDYEVTTYTESSHNEETVAMLAKISFEGIKKTKNAQLN